MFAYDTLDLIEDFFRVMRTHYPDKYDTYKKYYSTVSYSLAKELEFSKGDYTKSLLEKTGFDILEQNLSLYRGEELEIKRGKYISQMQIKYVFSNLEEKNLVTAPTNSGKTYGFLNYAKQTGKKIIFLSPYTSTTEQTIKQYGYDDGRRLNELVKLSGILESEYYEEVKEKIENGITNVLVATYDKSYQIQNLITEDNDWILIIDEAHNATSQYEFRENAIANVKRLEQQVEQTIYLTATPLGLKFNFDKVFNFKKDKQLKKAKIINISIIDFMLEVLIEERNNEGIDIIRINDKKKQHDIKNKLVKNNFYKADEILILNSQLKDTKDFKYLIKEERIRDSIKLVITTSLIDDGVNIKNSNINNLCFFNSLGINSLVQFPNRIRKGINGTFYIFSNLKKGKELIQIESFYKNYFRISERQVQEANLIWNIEKDSFDHRLSNNELIERLNENLNNKFIVFDDGLNEYIVDEQQILLSITKKLDGKLSSKVAKKVLKRYAKFEDVEIVKSIRPNLNIENNEDYSDEFKEIISNYSIDTEAFLEVAIKNLNLEIKDYPMSANHKIKELRQEYEQLDEIILDNNLEIKKILSYFDTLKIAKIPKSNRVNIAIKLYFNEFLDKGVTPNLFKSRLASAVAFYNNKLLRTPERFKLQQIEILEDTIKDYDELREVIQDIVGKYIKSPKPFLKQFFEVERTVKWCSKEKKSKSFLYIGRKFDLDSFYDIDFNELKESIKEKEVPQNIVEEINTEMKVLLLSNYR